MNVTEVLPRDAIPSIDDPAFADSYEGSGDDKVVVLDGAVPRAYPIRILSYHEIVNDAVERNGIETPVAVTWCPLCGSAVVYDRRVCDRVLSFGVSGLLADDDLVMYDRETESHWKQSTGRCFDGELAGTSLEVRPAAMTTWRAFREANPEGVVLQPTDMESEAASDDDSPAPIDYSVDPYEAYFSGEGFGLAAHRDSDDARDWSREDVDPKEPVLGIERGDEAVGYPRCRVEAAGGLVRDTVGGDRIVVVAGDGELHAFAHPGFPVELEDGSIVGDGTRWHPTSGESDDGRRLDRLPARRVFAFTWQDDHGADAFYEP